ncbi:MAG: hypothetical protein CSA23_07195 [Deltaproteobacteria bacterium]|nr:MAG: hypothetical protein CSA23_07195 [Deltaproteobacteria bacterium]
MDGHHLILGELLDCVTGETLVDTHDERYRQSIARLLMNEKGYACAEIRPRHVLIVSADDRKGRLPVDFLLAVGGYTVMMVKYGPGSLVTRHRSALAMSRLIEPYQIPVVVVTNGEGADVLNGETGKHVASGFDRIPSRATIVRQMDDFAFSRISDKRSEMESRIVYAFEIDGSCPCDDTACRIA